MKFSVLIGPISLLGFAYSVPVASNNITTIHMESMQIISEHFRTLETSDLPKNATEDGLSGPCKPVTMVFAKGTGENGNVGDGSSPGPALIAKVREIHGTENVAVQGVAYAADVTGYLLGGDPEGSERFLNLTNEALIKCPNTRLVIGGYSQGAQLAHNAAEKFSPEVTNRVDAAVVFGDPKNTQPIGSISSAKVLSICHDGDIICKYIGGTAAHLTYSQDASQAATFVMKNLPPSIGATSVPMPMTTGLPAKEINQSLRFINRNQTNSKV